MAAQTYDLTLYRGSWCLYWREDGQPKRRSLGTADKLVAIRRKAETERIEEQQRASSVPVRELWERYRLTLGDRPAGKSMGFEARTILPVFGDMLPVHITDKTVLAYTAMRHDAGKADGTILTELNRLATVLSWGVKHDLIAKAPYIRRPRRPPPKERHLTRAEARLLLDACSAWPHVHLFVTLALTTGARAQAILDLEWKRIDFEHGMVDYRAPGETRPMKGRVVCPMNTSARTALTQARDRSVSPFVIEWAGRKVGSVKKGVAAAARRAGLEDVTPHVFRHTAAVWQAEAEVPMAEIAQYLGHSDSRLTERVYARFSPQYRRKAAATLEL